MIEVSGLGRRETLAEAESTLAAQLRLDADQLTLAAHWADLHSPACLPPAQSELEARRRRLACEYGVRPGGEGTPEVLASCFAELGLVLRTSAGGAKHLVADALDLRHRLPRLWAEVQAGRVRGWRARRVAQATRHLPAAVMAEVDAGLAGVLPVLAWSRFEAVLDATVLRADPVGAAHLEAEAAARRFVSISPGDRHGLKTLIARGEVLDIVTFLAAVNRIADLLAVEGDTDPVEVRRSKAVGILGQPDRALTLLTAHQHDPDRPAPPTEPRQRGGWHRPASAAEPEEPEEAEESEPVAKEPEEATAPDSGPDDEPGGRSLDLTRPRPAGGAASIRVQLYVHLTDAALRGTDPAAVCRVEGVGPVTAGTVREWLARPDAKITVRPVTVPGQAVPVDGYEIPHSIREAVWLRHPASAFPWSWYTDRTSLQLDHIRAYLTQARGGPPGQTDPDNLAPLLGTEHQHKTSRRWQERSPAPGVYLWRSPHGWTTLVTNQGTFALGTTPTADALWHAVAPTQTHTRAA